jgi:NAD(P)-dependent dehydrogenase (short-subunit alcohol dehydrogenase family)
MVSAAVEAFARAAALDLERGIRINAVSPVWATETLQVPGRDAAPQMSAAPFVPAYLESLQGDPTGNILDARDHVEAPSLL